MNRIITRKERHNVSSKDQSYGEPTIVKLTESEAEPVAVHEGGGG
jgi:hypothetical protein